MIVAIPTTSRAQWLQARGQDVTASVAGALLGVHPYCTAYELWARKTGLKADVDAAAVVTENSITFPPLMRGTNLEANAIAMLPMLRHKWTRASVVHGHFADDGKVYYRDPEARLGATPDAIRLCPERGLGIIQIKTVEANAFKRSWRDADGDIAPPDWIVIQALIEAHLVGAKWAAIGALVVGGELSFHLVDVPMHDGIIERVKDETAAFWGMIERGEKPDPDYASDGDLIRSMYAPDGVEIDLSSDNSLPERLDERDKLKAVETEGNAAAKARKIIDAELLHKLGNANKARIADGRTISAKIVKRGAYSVEAASYPQIKISSRE